MTTTQEVLQYLNAVDYPADREALLQEAEREGAPPDVLKAIRGMPPVVYRNKEEVGRSVKTPIAEETPAEKGAKARDRKHQNVAEYLRPPGP
ncbi:DUF2795 domain-containing protein [Dactylosporangium sp. CA-139066]|uniref:DUF2795 domain-containing protein n=1 Tax=Dactylosporangium sp. CA-139066 TaxID=3239930 RepID=UPI003D8E7BAD